MIYLTLFWEFFRTGLFCVGGGLATLPFLFDMAARYPWFTATELADMVAVAESTPGPLGINMATYAGYSAAGVPGAVVATAALVLPPVLLSLLLTYLLSRSQVQTVLKRVFWGLRPAAAGLIAAVCCSLMVLAVERQAGGGLLSGVDWLSAALLAAFTAAVFIFKKHPILYVAIGAVVGIALKL